jgi:hypothetical protein
VRHAASCPTITPSNAGAAVVDGDDLAPIDPTPVPEQPGSAKIAHAMTVTVQS